MFLRDPSSLDAMYAVIQPGKMAGSRLLLSLMRTPRVLKHVLRHTYKTWTQLMGEVDLDDLFLINVLRYGAPEAFDFVLEYMSFIRLKHGGHPPNQNADAIAQLSAHFQSLWNAATKQCSFDARQALDLIFYLVPNAKQLLGSGDLDPWIENDRPQGVQHFEPTDYWARMLAEEVSPEELRDQVVLKLIEQANRGDVAQLAALLVANDKCPSMWGYFSRRMRGESLQPLATDVLRRLLRRDGSRAHSHTEALDVIWSRCIQRANQLTRRQGWLFEGIELSLPVSVEFCNDLFSYWASDRNGNSTPEERHELRQHIYRCATNYFHADSPTSLSDALDIEAPSALRFLVLSTDWPATDLPRCDPADWRWLGSIILDATQLQPDLMISHIVRLAGVYADGRERQYDIDNALVTAMFGDNSRQVYVALTRVITGYPREIETDVLSARSQAQAWLDNNPIGEVAS
jgi:hypothetical protein